MCKKKAGIERERERARERERESYFWSGILSWLVLLRDDKGKTAGMFAAYRATVKADVGLEVLRFSPQNISLPSIHSVGP